MNRTEQLEKALELACDYLVDAYNAPYDVLDYLKIYFKDGKAKYVDKMTLQEWKEYLLSEVSK